jgi:1-deoxy-D-xylulose-5-phosphate synthase
MPEGTGLDRFARAYPERFHDVGIAEQHAVTFAAGLSARGRRPVVAIYSTFLQRAYDQVLHDVCLQELPVIFALDRAGLVGEDGPTHHGAFDISYLRHIPNLTLMAPRDEQAIGSCLATALTLPGPCAVRYPRGAGTGAAARPAEIWPLGKGEVLRTGKGAAILAVGHMTAPALAAAELLAKDGIPVTVADPRFLKPLDEPLILALAAEHPLLVTVEENALAGGFGSAVLELLSARGRTARVLRLGIPDQFVEAGSQAELRSALGLDAEGIRRSVAAALRG